MGIVNKIWTAVRGHATEAGQSIVDANALTILDQEMRDADVEIRKSKDNLAQVMAKRKVAGDNLASKKAKLTEYATYVEAALAKSDEALATEIAGKIAELEGQVSTDEGLVAEYDASIESIHKSVSEAEDRLKRMKVKVDVVKAREHVIKASQVAASANAGANSKVAGALESLERLEASQAERQARIESANELAKEGTDLGLEEKLRAAGIKPGGASAQDVLARFRKPTA
jgi:phage shock protein A